MKYLYLTKPMTIEEMKRNMNEDCFIKGNIAINLSDAIDNDFEGFLDVLSESLTGSPLLMDISYKVVGFEDGDILIIEVIGDVSNILDTEDDE